MNKKTQIGEFVKFKIKNGLESERKIRIQRLHQELDIRLEQINKQWIAKKKQLQNWSRTKRQTFKEIQKGIQKFNAKKQQFEKLSLEYRKKLKGLQQHIQEARQLSNQTLIQIHQDQNTQKDQFTKQINITRQKIDNMINNISISRQIYKKKIDFLKNHSVISQNYEVRVKSIRNLKNIVEQKMNNKQKLLKQLQVLAQNAKKNQRQLKNQQQQEIKRKQFNINEQIQKMSQFLENNEEQFEDLIRNYKETYMIQQDEVKQLNEQSSTIINTLPNLVQSIMKNKQIITIKDKIKIKKSLFDMLQNTSYSVVKQENLKLSEKCEILSLKSKRISEQQAKLQIQQLQLQNKLLRMTQQIQKIVKK